MTSSVPTDWHLQPHLRPKSFAEMALPSDLREDLELFNDGGFKALLLVGDVGTGKTTSARILTENFQSNGGQAILIDGTSYTGHGASKRWETDVIKNSGASSIFLEARKKLFILEEAHDIPDVLKNRLKTTMENNAENVSWIFCVNDAIKINLPIRSRCTILKFPVIKRHPKTGKLLIDKMYDMTEKEWKLELRNASDCVATKLKITIPDSVYDKVLNKTGNLIDIRTCLGSISKEYKRHEKTLISE